MWQASAQSEYAFAFYGLVCKVCKNKMKFWLLILTGQCFSNLVCWLPYQVGISAASLVQIRFTKLHTCENHISFLPVNILTMWYTVGPHDTLPCALISLKHVKFWYMLL